MQTKITNEIYEKNCVHSSLKNVPSHYLLVLINNKESAELRKFLKTIYNFLFWYLHGNYTNFCNTFLKASYLFSWLSEIKQWIRAILWAIIDNLKDFSKDSPETCNHNFDPSRKGWFLLLGCGNVWNVNNWQWHRLMRNSNRRTLS